MPLGQIFRGAAAPRGSLGGSQEAAVGVHDPRGKVGVALRRRTEGKMRGATFLHSNEQGGEVPFATHRLHARLNDPGNPLQAILEVPFGGGIGSPFFSFNTLRSLSA